jgi:hypothetical protein
MPHREFNVVQLDSPKSGSEFILKQLAVEWRSSPSFVGSPWRSCAVSYLKWVLAYKGNSVLSHTGFDAPFKTLELAYMQAGFGE